MKDFSELKIHPTLRGNLDGAGFTTLTPVQAGTLPPAMEGQDVLATAKTGSGKTLAFAIPIAEKLINTRPQGIGALVLVPTRELAVQVFETFQQIARGSGIRGALVVGGLSEHTQLMAIRRGAQLVIATPGRLDDFVKRRAVDLKQVGILVLDEADRMVDMGFLPQMKTILGAMPPKRQTMCFSATLQPEVAHLVRQYLHEPARVEIGSSSKHAESVKLQVYEVSQENKFPLLLKILQSEPGTFLVFARTKRRTDRLGKALIQSDINASIIHGDRTQGQRLAALKGFQTGKYRVLVATDIAARGIHVDEIGHVINFDLPEAPEDFIHRVGRTGRAEHSGTASTFVTLEDRGELARIERLLQVRIQRLPLPEGMQAPAPRTMVARTPLRRSFGGRNTYTGSQPHPLEALRGEVRSYSSRRKTTTGYRHGRGDGPHTVGHRGSSRSPGRRSYSR